MSPAPKVGSVFKGIGGKHLLFSVTHASFQQGKIALDAERALLA
jgi:hypothetical protein